MIADHLDSALILEQYREKVKRDKWSPPLRDARDDFTGVDGLILRSGVAALLALD